MAPTTTTAPIPLVEWEFRYRARTMVTVRIRTYTEDEVEARAVAEHYLQQAVSSPNATFVYVHLACVASSAQIPALVERYGPHAQHPGTVRPEPELPDEPDDAMSGPVATAPAAPKPATRQPAAKPPAKPGKPSAKAGTPSQAAEADDVPPAAPMVDGEDPRSRARRLVAAGTAGRVGQ